MKYLPTIAFAMLLAVAVLYATERYTDWQAQQLFMEGCTEVNSPAYCYRMFASFREVVEDGKYWMITQNNGKKPSKVKPAI